MPTKSLVFKGAHKVCAYLDIPFGKALKMSYQRETHYQHPFEYSVLDITTRGVILIESDFSSVVSNSGPDDTDPTERNFLI
jgi:hypothetical protein